MRSRAVEVRVQNCQNGVQDWAQDAALFYPNPSNGMVYSKQSGTMHIFDLQGKCIVTLNVAANIAVDLSSIAPGIYSCSMNGYQQMITVQ
jgi:hypothetical protein